MIEILSHREVNKGALQSTINIKVKSFGLIFNEVNVFSKDGKRWISLPQKIYEEKGEKKYFPLIKFEDKSTSDKFSESVLNALDKKLGKQIETQEEFPF